METIFFTCDHAFSAMNSCYFLVDTLYVKSAPKSMKMTLKGGGAVDPESGRNLSVKPAPPHLGFEYS